jgi:hypothetical protein
MIVGFSLMSHGDQMISLTRRWCAGTKTYARNNCLFSWVLFGLYESDLIPAPPVCLQFGSTPLTKL